MLAYVVRRVAQLIPVGFGITLIVFVLVRFAPGDPVALVLGDNARPEAAQALRESMGLDRSIAAQYFIFLRNALHGDLGFSFFFHANVVDIVAERLRLTVVLMLYTVVLTVAIAIPLGVVGALHRESKWDQLIRVALTLGNGVPRYWLGMVLILLFALIFPIFPISRPHDPFPMILYSLFLPAMTTALGQFPTITRALRSNLIETLDADFVLTARAKGLSERIVFTNHALRASLIPAVTLIGVNISFLVGGQVVVEAVFGLPGLGSLMLNAISSRDYPVVQAATLVFATLVVVVNVLTDLVVALLDPRARVAG